LEHRRHPQAASLAPGWQTEAEPSITIV